MKTEYKSIFEIMCVVMVANRFEFSSSLDMFIIKIGFSFFSRSNFPVFQNPVIDISKCYVTNKEVNEFCDEVIFGKCGFDKKIKNNS